MMPRQLEAFAHRKAFCEMQVREAIAGGASRVLVLGAGYDALGPRDNLHLIPTDLGDRRLVDVLAAVASRHGTAQSVFIAEGLTLYLVPTAVRDLFAQCRGATGADSRIAFTYVGTGDHGRADVGRWTWLTL